MKVSCTWCFLRHKQATRTGHGHVPRRGAGCVKPPLWANPTDGLANVSRLWETVTFLSGLMKGTLRALPFSGFGVLPWSATRRPKGLGDREIALWQRHLHAAPSSGLRIQQGVKAAWGAMHGPSGPRRDVHVQQTSWRREMGDPQFFGIGQFSSS